jgi:hypothetical protein
VLLSRPVVEDSQNIDGIAGVDDRLADSDSKPAEAKACRRMLVWLFDSWSDVSPVSPWESRTIGW